MYSLAEDARLVGYIGLPFGIEKDGKTEFFSREEYETVLKVNQHTEVTESELIRKLLEKKLIDKNISHETKQYISYPAMYKKELQLSINSECNYRCRHCFMSAPLFDVKKQKQMNKDELFLVVNQAAECGIRNISITGGEPLVSPYFFDVLGEIKRLGLNLKTVYSNGSLFNTAFIDELKKVNLKPSFHFSYDGKNRHDWLRKIDGAEEAVVNAFKLSKQNGIHTSASMTLHKYNIDSINESIEYLSQLGCSYLKINIASPSGLWANEAEHFLTDDEAYEKLLNEIIPEYLKNKCIPVQFCGILEFLPNNTVRIPFAKFHGKADYACSAVKNHIYISHEGKVLPCMACVSASDLSNYKTVFEVPLKEQLTDSYYKDLCFSKASDCINNCKDCIYIEKCGAGCRASALNNCGSYFGIDENACRFFKNGWYEKTLNFIEALKW